MNFMNKMANKIFILFSVTILLSIGTVFADYYGPTIKNPSGSYVDYNEMTGQYSDRQIMIWRPSVNSRNYKFAINTYSPQGSPCNYNGTARMSTINNRTSLASFDRKSNCLLRFKFSRADGSYGKIRYTQPTISGASCNPNLLCGGREAFNMQFVPNY